MNRRGSCHDNAVAESFFQLLKRERIKCRIYPDRQSARADIFNYIEMFYNRQRKHGYNDMLSPASMRKGRCSAGTGLFFAYQRELRESK